MLFSFETHSNFLRYISFKMRSASLIRNASNRTGQAVRHYVDLAFWRYSIGNEAEKAPTSSSNRFVTCDYVSGTYKSPWANKTEKTVSSVLKWQMTSKPEKFLAKERNRPYPQPVPVQRSKMFIKDKPHCTWIGHATVVYQTDGINFITDPVFSDACSPIPQLGSCWCHSCLLLVRFSSTPN